MTHRKMLEMPFSISIFDLLGTRFDWNVTGKHLEPQANLYGAIVRVFTEGEEGGKELGTSAICELSVSRTGHKFQNFHLEASYYYTIDRSDDRPTEQLHKTIVASSVWVKFCDLAKFTFMQAEIRDVRLPHTLDDIKLVRME